jgi:serine/threonine-protein kinase
MSVAPAETTPIGELEASPAIEPVADSEREALPVPLGEKIADRYVVDGVLATGGMGIVCLAHHIELEHSVAIKFLRHRFARNDAVVERFLGEARSLASLRSRHVVRIIDVGQLATGTPYLVMEYLEGTDLETLLMREGPLPVERAVDYVLQACEALAEAHAAGIVHRDVKPENLFLAGGGDAAPIVKVVDFGIAKRLDTTRTKVVTGPTDSMGSPCYMSPEQMASPRAVDARTDVWSIGVVLYRLLSGGLPFDGDSLVEIFARVVHAPVPRLAELRPEVDRHLERIVERCLEKKPEARHPSIAALAEELSTYRAAALSQTSPSLTPTLHSTRYPSDAPVVASVDAPVDSAHVGRRVRSFLATAAVAMSAAIAGTALRPTLGQALSAVAGGARRLTTSQALAPTAETSRAARRRTVVVEPLGVIASETSFTDAASNDAAAGPLGVRALRETSRKRHAPKRHAAPRVVDHPAPVAVPAPPPAVAAPDDSVPTPTPEPSMVPLPAASATSPMPDPNAPAADERADAASREERYKTYLQRHGWRPLRDVLDELRGSHSEPPGNDRPAAAPGTPTPPPPN